MSHEIQPTNLRRHRGAIVTATVFTGALAALLIFAPGYGPQTAATEPALAQASQQPAFFHAPSVDPSLPAARVDAPIDPSDLLQPPTF